MCILPFKLEPRERIRAAAGETQLELNNMKNTFLILICVFVILGCKNQKRVDNELYKCLEEFNNVLQEVNFGANTNQSDYFFDTIFEIIPTFIPTFYTSDFLENFYFFKVKNDIGEMNLALEKKSEHNCHKLYFIEIENLSEDSIISYVDENEYLTGHFSFFENCGFKLETLNIIDSVNYKWYGNIFNMNDIG